MLYLSIIYHMHQPYYRDLLTGQVELPWVRLHASKDYKDMVQILDRHPGMRLNFNLVPSLVEQIEAYSQGGLREAYLDVSYKKAEDLSEMEKAFLLEHFFSINPETVICLQPRYYQLLQMHKSGTAFSTQDYLDLQVWFNLAWIDPRFRQEIPELRQIVDKGRFYSEEEKRLVLDKQLEILKGVIPVYRKFQESAQIEVSVSPYYHPILPLLYSTNIAKEADTRTILPKIEFSFPQDASRQIADAVALYKRIFGRAPCGMWPSEEAVSRHIVDQFIDAGIKWIVTDEAILFKSLKRKKRDTELLYQPHRLEGKNGSLSVIFRDRNLSDLVSFVYHRWKAEDAAIDLMGHLQDIAAAFKGRDILVAIAMDGENAWEYYRNDGYDFLDAFYGRLEEVDFLKTITVKDYLQKFPAQEKIDSLAAGSWIYANFGKWMGNPVKVKAWEYLALARRELERLSGSGSQVTGHRSQEELRLAWKQMYILEGSDWFWWFGDETEGNFDRLFRIHLSNFYKIIGQEVPEYLSRPL